MVKLISSFENSVSELCHIQTGIPQSVNIRISDDKMADSTSVIIIDFDMPGNYIGTKIFSFDHSKLLQPVTEGEFFNSFSVKDTPFYSEDIDSDGRTEFFSNTVYKSYVNNSPSTSYIGRAFNFDKENGVTPKFYFIRNLTDGYYIRLPEQLSESIYYLYNKDDKKMDIYSRQDNKIIFSLKSFAQSDFSENSGYKKFASSQKKDLVYTYKISGGYSSLFTASELEENIKNNFCILN